VLDLIFKMPRERSKQFARAFANRETPLARLQMTVAIEFLSTDRCSAVTRTRQPSRSSRNALRAWRPPSPSTPRATKVPPLIVNPVAPTMHTLPVFHLCAGFSWARLSA